MTIKPTTPESFDGAAKYPVISMDPYNGKGIILLSANRFRYLTCPKRLPRKLKKKLRKMVMVETNDFSPPLRWRNIDKRYRKYLLSDPKMRFPFNAEEAKTK